MSPRSSHHDPGSGAHPGWCGPSAAGVPPRGTVADFPPVFAGRGRGRGSPRLRRLRRLLRPRGRLLAAGLTLSAVGAGAVAVAPPPDPARAAPAARPVRPPPGEQQVSAPVRFADAGAVALLNAGDRVDVIATSTVGTTDPAGARGATGAEAPHVVTRCAPVLRVPHRSAASPGPAPEGALVVLRVSRRTATELAGSASDSPLSLTLC